MIINKRKGKKVRMWFIVDKFVDAEYFTGLGFWGNDGINLSQGVVIRGG